MAVHPHGSIISDGAGLDKVHVVKHLRQCQMAILSIGNMEKAQLGVIVNNYRLCFENHAPDLFFCLCLYLTGLDFQTKFNTKHKT